MMKWLDLSICLLLLSIGIGCESSLDPLNEDVGTYSIYGYLDVNEDENYARIKDLNVPFDQDTSEGINAEVIFENLDEGTTEILNDTTVEFDGVETHNYRITTQLQFDTRYRLTINTQNEEKKVTADATTPQKAEVDIQPENKDCETPRTLSFAPVPNKFALDVDIGFRYEGEQIWVRSNHRLEETGNGVYMEFTPLNIMGEHFAPIRVFCDELTSDIFRVRYTHYGPDLFENTISDSLNIPGGAGRFGALYSNSFTFQVDTTDS